MSRIVVPIVEGHAEVESAGVLLRRLMEAQGRYDVDVAKPVRVGRYKVVRPGELERAIELARRKSEGCDAIVVLLDADDDCPGRLGPDLLARAANAGHGVLVSVVPTAVSTLGMAAGQALTLADISQPTPTPTPPLLDLQNDIAQAVPGWARL